MNTFTDILFIFVFVFVILHFGLINITSNNVVTQKLYMFIAVTMFASMLYVMKSIRRQCPIKVWDVISSGLIIGMLAYVGHTLMFDMWYMKETHDWIANIVDEQYFTLNIVLSLFICFAIAVGKSVGYIFNTDLCSNQ